MKIPNRVVGFLDYKEKQLPFELDKDTFELRLYFPTEKYAYEHLFDGISSLGINLKEHKWIDKIVFTGKTAEGYYVYLGTTDNPGNYNGYPTYNVDWYYISDNNVEKIIEIRFSGREINYFYNPNRVFQQNIKFQEEKSTQIESMNTEAIKNEDLDCGSYEFNGKKVEISCSAFATMHFQSDVPFDAKSYLNLKFVNGIEVEELTNESLTALHFVKYVAYRTNIEIDPISTYYLGEDGLKHNCGSLVFNLKNVVEANGRAKERIIKAEYLNRHVGEIFELIEQNRLQFGHVCESIDDRSHYPTSRIIMILSAFEREFRNVYGQDARRSNDYKRIKEEVIKMLDSYAETLNGKKKKYVKNFAKGIQNADSSYGDNFEFALNDCKDIMEPFVIRQYNGTYEEIAKEVGININNLRNGVAHSRLDLELEPRCLTDIKFAEELLYAMRFKKLQIETKLIQKSINDLFKENMAL